MQKVLMFATWCIPSEATRFSLKKKIYQLFKNIVLHCNAHLEPSAPSTSFWNNFSKIYKILAVFVCFRESLDLHLDHTYRLYDKLTLGWLISWTNLKKIWNPNCVHHNIVIPWHVQLNFTTHFIFLFDFYMSWT